VGGAEEGIGHIAGRDGDLDAALLKNGDLGRGGIFRPADDGAGVAHAPTCGSGGAGDEAGDGLVAVGLDPAGGLDLGVPADLANHDDAVSFWVLVEKFDDIKVRGAINGIAADANARRLANVF
jgi:hypothetical protein